jgi:hypothetical protein
MGILLAHPECGRVLRGCACVSVRMGETTAGSKQTAQHKINQSRESFLGLHACERLRACVQAGCSPIVRYCGINIAIVGEMSLKASLIRVVFLPATPISGGETIYTDKLSCHNSSDN